jgi:hypothetical protein
VECLVIDLGHCEEHGAAGKKRHGKTRAEGIGQSIQRFPERRSV